MNKHGDRIILPGWMEAQVKSDMEGGLMIKRRHNFLQKSIHKMKETLSEELVTERYAAGNGILQSMDARLKLGAALLFIIMTGLIRSIPILVCLWAFTVILMFISGLPVFTLQKRIWGIIPLLTLLASIPAMLNIIIDGTPLLMIYQTSQPTTWLGVHLPASIYVSKQGFGAAVFLFLRVGLSISMGVLLTITTPVASLLKSLQIIGIPSLVVMIIEMSYRYLVLLLCLSIEMFEARSLRTVGYLSMKTKRAQFGSSMAALFSRSMTLADEVYLAMTARGYTGQAVSSDGKQK